MTETAKKSPRITPQKVRDIVIGVKMAKEKVASFEIDGIIVHLSDAEEEHAPGRGHQVKWSKS